MNARKILHWSLLAAILLYLISGLGISYYGIVETATFGLLSKNLSFSIHEALLVPFVILLVAHVALTVVFRKK